MAEWLEVEWLEKFNALRPRERLLLAGVALLLVFFILDALLLAPQQRQRDKAEKQLQQSQQQLLELQSELQVLSSVSGSDPDRTRRQQITELNKQLAQLDDDLSRLSAGLIPAQQLPALLREVLRNSEQLRLLSIRTLPITQLSLQGQEMASDPFAQAPSQDAAGVFKHAVEIELNGGFFAIRDYLEQLQGLPWRLYWEGMSYSVTEYPRADVQLRVYTLSTAQGAFGD